jgi:hypothetical protein
MMIDDDASFLRYLPIVPITYYDTIPSYSPPPGLEVHYLGRLPSTL